MSDDPRKAQGSIVGPEDPYGVGNVFIDAKNALLLEGMQVSMVGAVSRGTMRDSMAIELQGRINKTDEHISVMVMTNADGAAALVSELLGVASRGGFAEEFTQRVKERMEVMPT